jgi:acetolactate synthase-1/2/3 large subunit
LAAAGAVVPGPGLQNASAGIGTAYTASLPILVISGQIERGLIGVDRGMLHEVNDQKDGFSKESTFLG